MSELTKEQLLNTSQKYFSEETIALINENDFNDVQLKVLANSVFKMDDESFRALISYMNSYQITDPIGVQVLSDCFINHIPEQTFKEYFDKEGVGDSMAFLRFKNMYLFEQQKRCLEISIEGIDEIVTNKIKEIVGSESTSNDEDNSKVSAMNKEIVQLQEKMKQLDTENIMLKKENDDLMNYFSKHYFGPESTNKDAYELIQRNQGVIAKLFKIKKKTEEQDEKPEIVLLTLLNQKGYVKSIDSVMEAFKRGNSLKTLKQVITSAHDEKELLDQAKYL